jgi:hypothetical protein
VLCPISSLTLEGVFPPTSLTLIHFWVKGLFWSWEIKFSKVLVWWRLMQPFLFPFTISFTTFMVSLSIPLSNIHATLIHFLVNNIIHIHW